MPRLFEQAPDQVPVPNVISMTEKQARAADRRRRARGRHRSTARPATRSPPGKVIRQDPDPDDVRRPGHRGQPRHLARQARGRGAVRDRAGQGRRRRPRWWRRASRSTLKEEESDEDKDTVTRTEPVAGRDGRRGHHDRRLLLRRAARRCPTWSGKQQADAETAIRNAGFEPRVIDDRRHHRAGRHRDRPEPARGRDAVGRARRSRSSSRASSSRPRPRRPDRDPDRGPDRDPAVVPPPALRSRLRGRGSARLARRAGSA